MSVEKSILGALLNSRYSSPVNTALVSHDTSTRLGASYIQNSITQVNVPDSSAEISVSPAHHKYRSISHTNHGLLRKSMSAKSLLYRSA